MGAKKVYAADLVESKLNLALKMGGDEAINVSLTSISDLIMRKTEGNGIERICEASGHAPTLNQSFKVCLQMLTIVILECHQSNFRLL